MRPETVLRRAWRRLRTAVFVTVAARSIRITLEAARRHDLIPVSTFLTAGGKLTLESALYKGAELPLGPDAWSCLGRLGQLLKHGADIRKTDQGFAISLASGRIFELPSDSLLSAAFDMLHERFVADEYAELEVAGAVVIDVGAHIGDSAIYFADRGAAHVYAFEPFREPYATAVRVVRRNLLQHIVTVTAQGVGARDGGGISFYNPNRSDLSRGMLRSSTHQPPAGLATERAEEIQLVSLPSVLDMARKHHPDRPLVLKMDCEGCEFDGFEAEGIRESLSGVKSILLEVHYDDCHPSNAIRTKLEECGFSVAITQERAAQNVSLLLATRETETGEGNRAGFRGDDCC